MTVAIGCGLRTTGASVQTAARLRALFAPSEIDALASPSTYMARHSRSFRFAARLLRGPERACIARLYAWCRFTDDLADTAAANLRVAEARLDAWIECARVAYAGRPSGIPLVDRVMGDMAERGIPFAYASALATGVRSDLRFVQFRDLDELRFYTYRVAAVIGLWLTELHGVRDPWMLERAAALGHAMQLTNILRDVGEDWDRGRVYIPRDVLHRNGLATADIGAMRRRARPIDAPYRDLIEELIAIAARDYRMAAEAIPHLPPAFRRSVAVAAAVYAGIHRAIRRNGYDNLGRRAVTTATRKVALAAGALWTTARAPALRAAL